MEDVGVQVRALTAFDLPALHRDLPVWSALEYDRRLHAQGRAQLVQAVAWIDEAPVGRGMILFPEHEEFSDSAVREGCAEVRDVFVVPAYRRRGIARALMEELEAAARAQAFRRIGLAVGIDEDAVPARALYEALGYRHAHGPFVSGATLMGDDGPEPVGAVVTYLVKDL